MPPSGALMLSWESWGLNYYKLWVPRQTSRISVTLQFGKVTALLPTHKISAQSACNPLSGVWSGICVYWSGMTLPPIRSRFTGNVWVWQDDTAAEYTPRSRSTTSGDFGLKSSIVCMPHGRVLLLRCLVLRGLNCKWCVIYSEWNQ